MSDDKPGDAKVGGGGDDGGGSIRRFPALSRGERLALADVLVHWSTSIDGMREVVDGWSKRIDDLRRLGEALTELDFDRALADGLSTVRAMAATEQLSADTRTYFRNLLGVAATVEFPE